VKRISSVAKTRHMHARKHGIRPGVSSLNVTCGKLQAEAATKAVVPPSCLAANLPTLRNGETEALQYSKSRMSDRSCVYNKINDPLSNQIPSGEQDSFVSSSYRGV
jgi:hypothetical protein